ncbi:MAG TPA: hypothetical protein VGC27_09055 [Rhizomicrobium sp.]
MLGTDRDSIRESVMAKKMPLPKAVTRPKPKAKAAKPPKRAAAPRKKTVRRKKAGKPESTFKKIENAILVGVAEADEVALSLGLLGATPPRKSRKKRR